MRKVQSAKLIEGGRADRVSVANNGWLQNCYL